MAASQAQGLQKLIAAGRSAGRFVLMVAAINIGVLGVYKARATLDARAARYSHDKATSAASYESYPSEIANPAIPSVAVNPAIPSEPANPPVPPATATAAVVAYADSTLTASEVAPAMRAVPVIRDLPEAAGDEQQGELPSVGALEEPTVEARKEPTAEVRKDVDARFTTIHVNRGSGPPTTYLVPRQ